MMLDRLNAALLLLSDDEQALIRAILCLLVPKSLWHQFKIAACAAVRF